MGKEKKIKEIENELNSILLNNLNQKAWRFKIIVKAITELSLLKNRTTKKDIRELVSLKDEDLNNCLNQISIYKRTIGEKADAKNLIQEFKREIKSF